MSDPRPQILVIDDTPANLFTLGAALAADFDLRIATSGQMGLTLASEEPPSLILLDVMMPEMDGFETCRRFKAIPELAHVPIIFVTAMNEPTAEVKGLALGAADYIAKPINVDIARQRIRNLLEREQLRLALEAQRDQLESGIRESKRAQQALEDSERRFRDIVDYSPLGMVICSLDGRVQQTNRAFCAMLDYPPGVLEERSLAEITHPGDFAASHDMFQQLCSGQIPRYQLQKRYLRQDGLPVWTQITVSLLGQLASGSAYVLAQIEDITQRRQSEERLGLAASVFTHAREGIMITSADGTIIDVNDAFSHITSYSRDEVIGANPRLLNSGRQGKGFYAAMWGSLIEKGHWYGEVWNRRKNGEVYAEMLTISAVCDSNGSIRHYVALFSDITALKQHEQQLEHIAHYDALTSLPNRVLLADRLHQAIMQTQRRGQRLAVAYLDLDGFKAINDVHGHQAGDQLLMTVAARMKLALRECDTLARLGGDEFVAVLLDLADIEASVSLLSRLLAAAAQPVHVGDLLLQVSASIGVTFYPQPEEADADLLLRQADQAMYQAKLAGKNRYHIFDAEQDRNVRGHHESLDRIRRALADEEFVLYYQPKVNMLTGEVVGAEALIRWQHPEKGLLPPIIFLPVIEEHPLASELGEWVIDTALAQMAEWHRVGLDIPVSVNIGARQLQQDNFVDRLRELLAAHPGVLPGRLELEVLETSALEDLARVSQVIEACREIGVMFALDDFGTGYSSLTYLKRLPVKLLKIDQSFVRGMLDDPDDLAILEGVLGLSAAFRRQVIAEGVETVEHGAMLLQLGCQMAQGYVIARPMPAAEFPAWSLAWRTHPTWGRQLSVSRDDLPLLFASVEHRAWVTAIKDYLHNERGTPPPLDCHQCRFGQWVDTEGKARHGQQPAFLQLEAMHQEVHAMAATLCKLDEQGCNSEALLRLSELHGLQECLLGQLTTLLETQASTV